MDIKDILEQHKLWVLNNANGLRANLSVADLYGANLYGAHLTGANLSGATKIPQIVPEIGQFMAFKKLKSGGIATLLVSKNAKRVGGLLSRKCRVSKVKVLSISNGLLKDVDMHTGNLVYEVGKWVIPDSFDDDIRLDCTNGIHCFITRKEAEDYA